MKRIVIIAAILAPFLMAAKWQYKHQAPTQEEWADAYDRIVLLEEHIHSVQRCYPDLANGITLTGGAGAWQLGAVAVMIPVNTVTKEFDIHFCNVASATAADVYQVKFYCGAMFATLGDSMIACLRTSKAAGANTSSPSPLTTPELPPNSQVTAQVASSSGGGDAIVISVSYHTY